MRRSPPKIITYTNEPLKVKNASLEKLKAKHGVVSELDKRAIDADLNDRSLGSDIHMAAQIRQGQRSELG